MLLYSNQGSGLFNQRYPKKEYICPTLIFFHAERHINNKEENRKSFHVR